MDADLLSSSSAAGRPLQRLHVAIERALADAGWATNEIDLVCVLNGPGSWTGIQVAVCTAKAIVQVHGMPLLPISVLDALAYSCNPFRGTTVAAMDARNDNVYASVVGQSGQVLLADTKVAVDELLSVVAEIKGDLQLVGDGAELLTRAFERRGAGGRVSVFPSKVAHAESLARLAVERVTDALTGDDRLSLTPQYLLGADGGPKLFGVS